jgi:hypothetical protein
MKIGSDTSAAEVAALVSEALEAKGIRAVLSGGGATSLYSDERYVSRDLDFVTSASLNEIGDAIRALGFRRRKGDRYFEHPANEILLEFPAGPLAIGDGPQTTCAVMETPTGRIQIITATQCVMDRLAAFYHWHDPQALEQALLVAERNEIDHEMIQAWSEREGESKNFRQFAERLNRR